MNLFKNTLRHIKYTLKTRYTICIDNGVANHMKCENNETKNNTHENEKQRRQKSKQTNEIVYD